MAKKYRLEDFKHLAGRGIFVDANVLIYLFWPTGQHSFELDYAQVFGNLLKEKNGLYVDFLVISEVVNRILRIEHQKLHSNQTFKAFRTSKHGKQALSDIYLMVKDNILKCFSVIGKSFNKTEVEGLLVANQLDFTDKAIVSICSENNLVLLTNDKDFKDSGLDILTSNPNILN